jgi:hypothetical protein
MMQSRNSAVFILSHGRPDRVMTYNTLRRQGYKGPIFIICDDEDKTLSQYQEIYKGQVIVFSKKDYIGKFDIMDNFEGNKVIVFARNACYDIARKLELDYFFEYEDDYHQFSYRTNRNGVLISRNVKNLNDIMMLMVDALESTNVSAIAFAQAGEHIGGTKSFHRIHFKRKAMNTFVFKVNKDKEDDIKFIGRMNDDVNTYLSLGSVGKIFMQVANIAIVQTLTQKSQGGNTEAYVANGTYAKSFYSVMCAPSCCKIATIGAVNPRIHHRIKWPFAVPKILDQKLKKNKV